MSTSEGELDIKSLLKDSLEVINAWNSNFGGTSGLCPYCRVFSGQEHREGCKVINILKRLKAWL